MILLGKPYAEIRRFIEAQKGRYAIRGAGDLSVEELVNLTGLTPEQARLAKQREFTEPFLLDDDAQLAALREEAMAAGLKITRGGRFHHLIGIGQDKGEAVRRVMEIFRENLVGDLLPVAIGDRPNDYPLLTAVDIPVLMPHPDGRYEELILPNLLKAPYPGSLGWGEAVTGILAGLEAGGKPVALGDIRDPLFVVGTERDHVSPWRSFYKIHRLADTDVTFVLTSGGHNAGVVNPPPSERSSFRITTKMENDRHTDPDTWLEQTPRQEGSWWPAWLSWLGELSGEPTAPPPMGRPEQGYSPLGDAPGTYVMGE